MATNDNNLNFFFSSWLMANNDGWTLKPVANALHTYTAVPATGNISDSANSEVVDFGNVKILLPKEFVDEFNSSMYKGCDITDILFEYWPRAHQKGWELMTSGDHSHIYYLVAPRNTPQRTWAAQWYKHNIGGINIMIPEWFIATVTET